MMRLLGSILLLGAMSTGCGRDQTGPGKGNLSSPPVSFRWVETKSAPELIEGTVIGTKERVYLHQDCIVVGEDLLAVMDMPGTGDKPAIAMKFTPTGQEKMERASKLSAGRRIALVVDGVIVCAIDFKGPMKEDAIINGTFSMEEAERIAKRMHECRFKK